MASHPLHRTPGVTYETAWFMSHRIRKAMKVTDPQPPMGEEAAVVEAGETNWGGSKRRRLGQLKRPRGGKDKMRVFTLVERGGRVRSFHVQSVNASTLTPILREHVAKHAIVMTDDAAVYDGLELEFAAHNVVNHSAKEYVRGNAHTQNIDGFFSILKRGLTGIYRHVSEQHLSLYLNEFDHRYTHRGITGTERSDEAVRGIEGKRLVCADSSAL